MSERALQTAVLDVAALYGWRAYHTFDSRRSQAGFPDLVLVRGQRLLFVELKVRRNKPSESQEAWLAALRVVPGTEVYVWYPIDWQDGTIEGVLQ